MAKRGLVVAVLALLTLAGCSSSGAGGVQVSAARRLDRANLAAAVHASKAVSLDREAPAPSAALRAPATPVPTTVARTNAVPTAPVPPARALAAPVVTETPPAGWGPGERGVGVLQLEERLAAQGYLVGELDNLYDGDTAQAVMAFQKVHGLERTGRATTEVTAAVNANPSRPAPLVPAGGFTRVEVDLDRQVLLLYENNALATIVNASTGSNERFCSQGYCRLAVTPPGAFTLYEQRQGWETGPLGSLYNSQYFNGGIAIHGSRSVPASPASHGCVRVSMFAADWLPERLAVGTPVYVVTADEPPPLPVGFDASAPPAPPTTAPPQTTTTRPSNLLETLLGRPR